MRYALMRTFQTIATLICVITAITWFGFMNAEQHIWTAATRTTYLDLGGGQFSLAISDLSIDAHASPIVIAQYRLLGFSYVHQRESPHSEQRELIVPYWLPLATSASIAEILAVWGRRAKRRSVVVPVNREPSLEHHHAEGTT
jgi:hypothetical protein